MRNKLDLEKYKEFCCSECSGKFSCCDIEGDLIDEQIIICMEANKNIMRSFDDS
jgi:hypothetical protein